MQTELIPAITVEVAIAANKYNLIYSDYEQVLTNFVETLAEPRTVVIVAQVNHSGHHFYLEDSDIMLGWSVADCTVIGTYNEPPAPYVAPFAPVTAPNTEQYSLVKDLQGYPTPERALTHEGKSRPITAGPYYIWSKTFNATGELVAVNLNNVQQPGVWVAVADNVPDPEPEPEPVIEPEPELVMPKTEWHPRWPVDRSKRPHPIETLPVDVPIIEVVPEPVVEEPPEAKQPNWRATRRVYQDGTVRTPIKFVALKTIQLTDPDGATPPEPWQEGDVKYMTGEFTYNGQQWAHWKGSSERFEWLGTPFVDEYGNQLIERYYEVKSVKKRHYVLLGTIKAEMLYDKARNKVKNKHKEP